MGNLVPGKTCLVGQIWMKFCDKICLWMDICTRTLLLSIITCFCFDMNAYLFCSSLAYLSSFVGFGFFFFCFLIGRP